MSKGNFCMRHRYYSVSAFIMLGMAVLLSACKETEIYPDKPSIEFKDYTFVRDGLLEDTLLQLTISYKDGNGDIGLNAGDTMPPYNQVLDTFQNNINPYYNNVFARYFELRNGLWVPLINPASLDTVKYEGRISNLTPEGKNRAIRGTIEWQIELPYFANRADTIMLNMWILDRGLHMSNIVQTPVIVLPKM